MSIKKLFVFSIFLLFFAHVSCKVEDIIEPNKTIKTITTFSLSFINTADINDKIILKSVDLDGEGGTLPAIVFLKLKPKSTYDVKIISLLNETVIPIMDYQPIVSNKKEEYIIFYEKNKLENLDLSINEYDVDRNGKQVGLAAKFRTNSISSGNLTIILKNQTGLKTLDSSIGITDKSASFMITIDN